MYFHQVTIVPTRACVQATQPVVSRTRVTTRAVSTVMHRVALTDCTAVLTVISVTLSSKDVSR